MVQITKKATEYTIGNAGSYAKHENNQNSTASTNGQTQKNLISFPASIPTTTEMIGCTAKNRRSVTNIPASALTVRIVIIGMINIEITITVRIIILRLTLFIQRFLVPSDAIQSKSVCAVC